MIWPVFTNRSAGAKRLSAICMELDAGDSGGCRIEALEPQHQPHSLFDTAAILFAHVVDVFVGPHYETCW